MTIAEKDIPKTALATRYESFEYMVMPFGLKNAPSTFMSMMNSIFRQYLDQFVVVYLDDIFLYSNSKEEHLKHLEIIFGLLRKEELILNLKKFVFLLKKIEYLGHVIGDGNIKIDDNKLAVVKEWRRPQNHKEVRCFLGLVNYFRNFAENLAIKAAPLYRLLQNDVPFNWEENEEKAFEEVKNCLTFAPLLLIPDMSKEFIVATDASGVGIGGI